MPESMSTLTRTQFDRIARTAKELWGLDLPEKKMALVSSRLAKHTFRNGINDVDAFIDHLQHGASESERLEFFDVLSTNVTSFFREPGAFRCLEQEYFQKLENGTLACPDRRLRIWSAACSTGPEPYSIAMTALDALSSPGSWKLDIKATDLASSVLEIARRGVYPEEMIESVDPGILRRYFLRGRADRSGFVRVAQHVRSVVSFSLLNLMDNWSFSEPFDVIFCRNCMIYFDRETRSRLVDRFHRFLRPGGLFVIGTSETLAGCKAPFRAIQPAIFARQ